MTLASVTNRELEAAAGLVTRLLIHNGEQCSPFHQPLDISKHVVVTLPIVGPQRRDMWRDNRVRKVQQRVGRGGWLCGEYLLVK